MFFFLIRLVLYEWAVKTSILKHKILEPQRSLSCGVKRICKTHLQGIAIKALSFVLEMLISEHKCKLSCSDLLLLTKHPNTDLLNSKPLVFIGEKKKKQNTLETVLAPLKCCRKDVWYHGLWGHTDVLPPAHRLAVSKRWSQSEWLSYWTLRDLHGRVWGSAKPHVHQTAVQKHNPGPAQTAEITYTLPVFLLFYFLK